MKTEPHARHHHEGEPPPESLIHHAEPTLLEQWFRRGMQQGPAFWGAVALVAAGVVGASWLAWRVGGPSPATQAAWTELAAVGAPPTESPLASFGAAATDADLPERLREIARAHPDTPPARWAELRAATLLLNEGSAELATTRRSAGAGKVVEADELFGQVYDAADNDALKRMAALGLARAAEARMGLDADDGDHAKLDDVLALYDRVIDDFPDTPEAEQAKALKRRLGRRDSIAFYEQLARFDPSSSLPSAPSLPGIDLPPGASSPLQNLLNLPPIGGSGLGSGMPSGSFPDLNLAPPTGLPAPSATAPAGMPEPVALPGSTPAASPEATPPVAPAPESPGAGSPTPSPSPETPRVPDDPFGSAPPTSNPATAVEPPATTPEPEPGPAPAPSLPDNVFPGDPNG